MLSETKKSFRKKASKVRRKLEETPKYYYIILAILTISLVSIEPPKILIILLILSDIYISRFMARSGPPGIGIELASITTALTGLLYGPQAGAAVGFLSIIFRIGVGLSGTFILWKIPGFAALGYLSGLHLESLIPGAIYMIITMRAIFTVISHFLERSPTTFSVLFSVTNLIFISVVAEQIIALGIL
jgi:hypothetical protein